MNGKHVRLLAIVASATFTSTVASAMPRSGESTGANYLVSAEDLSSWHVGAYFRSQERTVERDNMETSVDLNRGMVLAGYDLLSWLTVYGTAGAVDAKEDFANDGNTAAEYGVGAWFNLLDHDTFDYLETVQRFRIQGALQYSMFSNDDFSWGEMAGSLTFGVTHEIIGNKVLWPDAISLYAGPAVNVVVSDEYDLSSDNMFGLTVGMDVQVNKRTSVGVAGEVYQDDSAVLASISVRF